MKKKILLLLCFAFLSNKAFLQILDTANINAYYLFSHARDTMFLDKFYTENMVLSLGKTNSAYRTADQASADSARKAMIEKAQKDAETGMPLTIDMRGTKRATTTIIYKNSIENKMMFIEQFNKVNFLIEDALPTFSWTILEDTKQIQNYSCQKAITNFRGRSYEAWFCNSLPYNSGPWKFNGLPGLILEVYDTKRQVKFMLTRIEMPNNELIALPEKVSRTTEKEFKQMVQAARENMGSFLNSQATPTGGDVKMTTKFTQSGKNSINNPIELTKD